MKIRDFINILKQYNQDVDLELCLFNSETNNVVMFDVDDVKPFAISNNLPRISINVDVLGRDLDVLKGDDE